MIYAIDFDGTIAEDAYPAIGELKQNTACFIRSLQKQGHIWILWTMREGDKLKEAVDFLASHGLYPDYVNDNIPELQAEFGNNPRKVFAHVYIDDRNAGGLQIPVKHVW